MGSGHQFSMTSFSDSEFYCESNGGTLVIRLLPVVSQSVTQSNLYLSTVASSGLQKSYLYINKFKKFFTPMLH